MDIHVAKKQPPTEFHLPAFGKWHRALGKNWHIPLSHKIRIKKKTGKVPEFFKLFSTRVWKILFPDRKFDSHSTKSMGTWLNCIITPHKRALRRIAVFQSCPLQHEQNSTLVFKCSSYTMLSNVVWLYILKTTLWKLFRGTVLARFLSIDVRPACIETCLLKTRTCPRPLLCKLEI